MEPRFLEICVMKNMMVKDKSIAPMFVKGDIFLARYFKLDEEIAFVPGLCVPSRG